MLFKLSYIFSATNIKYLPPSFFSALFWKKKNDDVVLSHQIGFLSVMKNKLINNYHCAKRAQIDSLLP